jgi:hypothetical protein
MKEAAKSMAAVVGPIDLYQGAEIVETVSVDLPF